VAKKARTPKPPRAPQAPQRPVQAPQRRAGPARQSKPSLGQSRRFWLLGGLAVALIAVAIALPIALTSSSGKVKRALTGPINWVDLPGLLTGPPPWAANTSTMTARLPALGLNALGQEALDFHIHQHLDLYVNGKRAAVPRYVGIAIDPSTQQPILTELHTHDSTGLIHVESAQHLDYVLGQFFGVWGVKLTGTCIGRYCGNLHWWVNGKPGVGNPANLVLKSHQEIVIAYGKPPASIPSKYRFPAGT
jgi:hypothetical protein